MRNRIIYQSEALFTSQITGAALGAGTITSGEAINLQRITEVSTNAEITRQDANVFGKLASIDRPIIDEPTVSLDFGYYLANAYNENALGLTTGDNVNCLSGVLANSPVANRNYYILTVEEGTDANGVDPQAAGKGIVGIGNGFLSNYSVNLAVGEIPSASVSVEASNITFSLSNTNGIQNPGIVVTGATAAQYTGLVKLPIASTGTLDVAVLRPGDIVLDFGDAHFDMGGAILPGMTGTSTSAHVQSVSIDLPLSRVPQQRLGNSAAFSRELEVPISISLSVSANVADISEGSLVDLICAGQTERDITISLYKPCEADDVSPVANMKFILKGATLDSQNFSSTVGDNKTVDLTFTSQVGGPNDQTKGLFIVGS